MANTEELVLNLKLNTATAEQDLRKFVQTSKSSYGEIQKYTKTTASELAQSLGKSKNPMAQKIAKDISGINVNGYKNISQAIPKIQKAYKVQKILSNTTNAWTAPTSNVNFLGDFLFKRLRDRSTTNGGKKGLINAKTSMFGSSEFEAYSRQHNPALQAERDRFQAMFGFEPGSKAKNLGYASFKETAKTRQALAEQKKQESEKADKKEEARRLKAFKKDLADARFRVRNNAKLAKAKAKEETKLEKEQNEKIAKLKERIATKVGKINERRNPFVRMFDNARKSANNFGRAVTRILTYKIIRGALSTIIRMTKEGLNNMYQYSAVIGGVFKKNMDAVATSALYFKNSLIACATPLLNVILPVVSNLLDQMAELANKAGEFVARITGAESYSKAIKYAKEYQKVQRDILGFDVINKLSGQDDYSKMFTEVSLKTEIGTGSFTDTLRQYIENTDWVAVGTLLAEKLNEVLSTALQSDFSGKIGTFINKLADTFTGFIASFSWESLGSFVAGHINNMIHNIKISEIMSGIVNFFIGVQQAFNKTLADIDWEGIGANIVSFFVNIDWEQLLRNVSDLIKNILKGIWGVIKGAWNAMYEELLNKGSENSSSWTPDSGKWAHFFEANFLGGFADGGIPTTGSLFVAGEAGPELVTSMGGKSAVFNMEQLGGYLAQSNEGIIDAVLASANAIVKSVDSKPVPSVKIGDREIYNSSVRGSKIVGSSLIQGV